MKAKLILMTTLVAGQMSGSCAAFDLSEITQKINNNEYKQMTSVLVAQDNQLIYEQYFNQGGVDVKNDMRSASKSLTSMAVGLAIHEGLIKNVDQQVMTFFEDKLPLENADSRKNNITIEDLLTMSSPLECDDWNNASRGNEERMYLIEDWTQFILDLPIKGTPPWKKPPEKSKYGRAFSYCTGGVQVLADVVERVTKKPMATYLQEKVFNLLKISPPEFSTTPLGITNGGGGAKLTSRDWIKIGQMMMNRGHFNGQSVMNSDWVLASLKRRAVIDEERKTEYGYLWWIFDFKIGTEAVKNAELISKKVTVYAAAGNGGNYLFMIPSLNAQVVVTSQAYNTSYMHQQSQEILTKYIIPKLSQRYSP